MFNCRRPPWFNVKQYVPLQPRPSHHQIRTLWKPMCQRLKQQISLREIQLHTWSGHGATTRPYRQSYIKLTAQQPRQYFHWIQGSYWKLQPYLQNHPGLFLTDQPTTWQPSNTSIPTKVTHERITLNGTVLRITLDPYDTIPMTPHDPPHIVPTTTNKFYSSLDPDDV